MGFVQSSFSLLLLTVLLTTTFAQKPEWTANVRGTAAEFNETIEMLKGMLQNGIPLLNIPPMDPLSIDKLPIVLDTEMLKVNLLVQDVLGTGTTDFVAHKIELDNDKLNLKLGITLHKLKLYFRYAGNMTVFTFIPIYGEGDTFMELNDYDLDLDLQFKTTEDGQYLRSDQFVIKFTLKSCSFDITGLLNNEDASKLISQSITDMVPSFIEDHQEWLTNTYSPILASLLDKANLEVDAIFG